MEPTFNAVESFLFLTFTFVAFTRIESQIRLHQLLLKVPLTVFISKTLIDIKLHKSLIINIKCLLLRRQKENSYTDRVYLIQGYMGN